MVSSGTWPTQHRPTHDLHRDDLFCTASVFYKYRLEGKVKTHLNSALLVDDEEATQSHALIIQHAVLGSDLLRILKSKNMGVGSVNIGCLEWNWACQVLSALEPLPLLCYGFNV